MILFGPLLVIAIGLAVMRSKRRAQQPSWLADPTGRHELRYWDGAAWTESVSDSGVQGRDAV